MEVPDADHQAARGEGFAIRWWIRGSEIRVVGDERAAEGLACGAQDGEKGEFGMWLDGISVDDFRRR